jgi:hypothetical protein
LTSSWPVGCEEFEVFFSGPGRDQFTGSHAVFNVEVCCANVLVTSSRLSPWDTHPGNAWTAATYKRDQ